jgi:hypothetical protein
MTDKESLQHLVLLLNEIRNEFNYVHATPTFWEYVRGAEKYVTATIAHEHLHDIAAKPMSSWTVRDCYDFLFLSDTAQVERHEADEAHINAPAGEEDKSILTRCQETEV